MKRSQIREHVFNLLFGVEFNAADSREEQTALHFDLNDVSEKKDKEEIQRKFNLISEKLPALDEKINEVTVGWKTGRMNKVDLAILRLAFFEILYDEDVPNGVAINEAVELAKKYSSESGARFVNGVLARLVNP